MSNDLGTYALWAMAAVVFLLFLSIVLKTKWWHSAMGINIMTLSGWFVMVMLLIILGTLGLLPDWLRPWIRLLVYGSGAGVLVWRILAIWVWNWNFWAWSKTERQK